MKVLNRIWGLLYVGLLTIPASGQTPPGGGGGSSSPPTSVYDSQYLKYEPESGTSFYQIRKGMSDNLTVDNVTPIDWYGNAICVKQGGQFKMRLVDTQPESNVWEVLSAKLYNPNTGHIYWQQNSSSGQQAENTTWPSSPITLPSCIEYLKLDITYVATIGFGGPTGNPVTLMGSNEIFVVYNQPTEYMSTAWVNVMRWSCQSAVGESSPYYINDALTNSLWEQGDYDITATTHISSLGPNYEEFYARSFIDAGLKGRCSDFADFLAISLHSQGLYNPQPYRSFTHSLINGTPQWGMVTNSHWPAGGTITSQYPDPSVVIFNFHQFVIVPDTISDGAVRLELSENNWVSPVMVNESYYEVNLVTFYWRDTDGDHILEYGEVLFPGDPLSPWSPTQIALQLKAGSLPL